MSLVKILKFDTNEMIDELWVFPLILKLILKERKNKDKGNRTKTK